MIIEYLLKFDMVLLFVSLFTIIVLMISDLPVPRVLIWIFIINMIFIIVSYILIRIYKSKKNSH